MLVQMAARWLRAMGQLGSQAMVDWLRGVQMVPSLARWTQRDQSGSEGAAYLAASIGWDAAQVRLRPKVWSVRSSRAAADQKDGLADDDLPPLAIPDQQPEAPWGGKLRERLVLSRVTLPLLPVPD